MLRKALVVMVTLIIIASVLVFSNSHGDVVIDKQVSGNNKILVVPLDDRPVSVGFIERNASIGGMEVIMPPKDIIGDIDTPGDADEILKWILEEGDSASHFIISATMMNHGGLIHSRLIDDVDYKSVDWVDIIREKFPDKEIYVYDVIQRLATSVFDMDERHDYINIRRWATLKDEMSTDPELISELNTLEQIIDIDLIDKYNKTRDINHKMNMDLIDKVSDGSINQLILGQDDASSYGVHIREQEIIENKIQSKGLSDKISVIVGADEIGLTLLAKITSQLNNNTVSYKIIYSNPLDKYWIGPYEDRNLEDIIYEHIDIIGGEVTNEDADINLFINKEDDVDLSNFHEKIVDYVNNGKNVSIVDLRVNLENDAILIPYLSGQIDLSKLMSYNAWNTVGNAVGIGLANSVMKHNSDLSSNIDSNSDEAHYKFLYERLAKDYVYKQVVKGEVNRRAKSLGIDIFNISEEYEPTMTAIIRSEIEQGLYDINQSFGSDNTTKCEPFMSNITLPWHRLFEVNIEVQCVS